MIKFSKNELNKAKVYAYHYTNQNFLAREYLKECKDDLDIIYLKALYLCYNREYREAVELLKPYVIKNNYYIVDLYVTVMTNNLNRYNEAYNLMKTLAIKRKCFGYYGLFRLIGLINNVTYECEYRDLINKAFKCANMEEKIILTNIFVGLLFSAVFKEQKTKELYYELLFNKTHFARETSEQRLYLINKLENENEKLNKIFRKRLMKLIFNDFDGASALILGLYMLKHNKRKKIDYNDPAFTLFYYGYKLNDKLCSILYALKFGHKDIKDLESLNKAAEILSNIKDVYAINIGFIPISLLDTFNLLLKEFKLSLTKYLVNLYKVHPFISGVK